MEAAELVMLQSWRRPAKLFSDFDAIQFAIVMAIVMFVLLLISMVETAPHHSMSPVLPRVDHPISMPGADYGDAMRVSITRDGKIYFGSEQVTAISLSQKLSDRLKNPEVERKVYINADMRARWETVEQVLDSVRAAGLVRVAFLVDQKRSAAFHM